MRPQEIIEKKRDGLQLSNEEIDVFIDGVCDGSWADYQISALLMAMFLRGLDAGESAYLTRSMVYSGEVLDLSEIDRPKADKHSTGGVGDKTSIVIAPLAAACGLAVPMISGRGLGHTGGTLDKLESIPGYNVRLTTQEMRSVIMKCGFAMAGQTAEIAPADKKLYALRDATATVPYIPLIVASIMSKKLAEGLDALVLDVKTGSGAFMVDIENARSLATELVATGRAFGVNIEAVISNMSEPLGRWVGNSCEIGECIRILRGESQGREKNTEALSIELTARMLTLAGLAESHGEALDIVRDKLGSGRALEVLRQNIELQGGDPHVCDDPDHVTANGLETFEITAASDGFIHTVDTLAVGNALVSLGGGRVTAEDDIDNGVGFAFDTSVGDVVSRGDVLASVHCRDRSQYDLIRAAAEQFFTLGDSRPEEIPLVREIVTG